MSFSKTAPITLDAASAAGSPDALFRAWSALREARQLPYHASRMERWHAGFLEQVNVAFRAFSAHVAASEQPASGLAQVERAEPVAASLIRRQFGEHAQIRARLAALARDTAENPRPDLLEMVHLSERAIEVEIDLARHHNRLRWVIEERYAASEAVERPAVRG